MNERMADIRVYSHKAFERLRELLDAVPNYRLRNNVMICTVPENRLRDIREARIPHDVIYIDLLDTPPNAQEGGR